MDNFFVNDIIGYVLTNFCFFIIYSGMGSPQERLARRGAKKHGDKIPVINLLFTGEGKVPYGKLRDKDLLAGFYKERDVGKKAALDVSRQKRHR